jgi:hypothetical protein
MDAIEDVDIIRDLDRAVGEISLFLCVTLLVCSLLVCLVITSRRCKCLLHTV